MSQDRSSSVGDAADDQRYVVVSIDSHVGPSVKDQLRPYCEAQYLDDFDRFVAEMESQGLLSWRSSEAKSGEKQSWSLGKSLAERGKAEAEKLGQDEAEKFGKGAGIRNADQVDRGSCSAATRPAWFPGCRTTVRASPTWTSPAWLPASSSTVA